MKKKRFTEEQIAYALAQETGGETIAMSASTCADSVSSVSRRGCDTPRMAARERQGAFLPSAQEKS